MNQYTIENPDGHDFMVMAKPRDEASLMELQRYGVVIRRSTQHEIDEVNEKKSRWIDAAQVWPEDEGTIIMTIKDW